MSVDDTNTVICVGVVLAPFLLLGLAAAVSFFGFLHVRRLSKQTTFETKEDEFVAMSYRARVRYLKRCWWLAAIVILLGLTPCWLPLCLILAAGASQ